MKKPVFGPAFFVCGDLNRAPHCCRVAMLRGRKTVRADRRSWIKTRAVLVLSITVFSVRMVFIRAENTVGARSAQARSSRATVFKTPRKKPKRFRARQSLHPDR